MLVRSRRLATALVVTLTACGATVAVAGPAEALPTNCTSVYHGYIVNPGVSVTALYGWNCVPVDIPQHVTLQKDGAFAASGNGTATYLCSGTAENTFSGTGSSPIEVACG